MLKPWSSAAAVFAFSSPALAHGGDHSGLVLSDMIGHLLEWDHLLIALSAVAVGLALHHAFRRRLKPARQRKSS